MAVFNGAFPVLPGKIDAARAFAREVTGPRLAGFEGQQRAGSITRETWSLQETPAGAFMLVWFEAADVDAAFADVGSNTSEFTTWFRGRVKEVTGVDLAAPPDGPAPELLVEWKS